MRVALSMLVVTVANWVMKASGPLALGHRQLPRTARRIVALMAPTLLAGLIVVELGDPDGGDLNWTQIVGVVVAGAARLLKLPMLLAVLCGAAATAVLRLM